MNAGGPPRPFPWDDVLHLAFRLLRWPPEAVWRATPRKIAWALALPGQPGAEAPSRKRLAALMGMFPDQEKADNGSG